MEAMTVDMVALDAIQHGPRFRKDLGDIPALAASIRDIGLLQPIGVDSTLRLVFGGRRVAAYRELGRTSIPARIVSLDDIILGEFAENEMRKDFTVSERVAIARAIEERLAARHGGDRRSEEVQGGKISTLEIPGEKSRDLAAKQVGFGSGKTYEAAKRAVDTLPDALIDALDDGRISVNLASEIARLPEADVQVIAQAAPDEVREVARDVVHNHRAQGTGENEWYTPGQFIESARAAMGSIDLDPASAESAQTTVQASKFFTADDDGLSREWCGNVWLNPPYAQPAIQQFVEKAIIEVASLRVRQAIVLTHNYTDTRWFHLAALACDAMCFTRGRIGFLSPDGRRAAPTQGQTFFYFGPNIQKFADEFSEHGFIVRRV